MPKNHSLRGYFGCNLKFARLLHLNASDEIIGQTDYELLSPFLKEAEISFIKKAQYNDPRISDQTIRQI